MDYYHIKWFIDRKQVTNRELRKGTKLRMSLEYNKLRIIFLKPEDSALYSCQMKKKSKTTPEELALNSTNFKLQVYSFIGGGVDVRSPKVFSKIAFIITFLGFCILILNNSLVYIQFA